MFKNNRPSVSDQRLQLRCEHQTLITLAVVERLDAQWIAGQVKFLTVGNGECKHPIELFRRIDTGFTIQVQDRFGIAAGAKTVPIGEIDAELWKVVDFTVGNDRTIFSDSLDGLTSAARVHDGEPPVSQHST